MTEWDDLFDRHRSGELTESEMERLAELLDGDPRLRKDYVQRSAWETELAEVLRTGTDCESSNFDSSITPPLETRQGRSSRLLSAMLAIATITILMLTAMLFRYQNKLNVANSQDKVATPESIAQITGLRGALIWTGDRGEIVQDISVGTQLAGGTIEGLAPDSWFELQFHDGSTVMISGTSLLTFADLGQKKLRLREGRLSANVKPQPDGQPMLIHTRSAVLKVLGTQFDVEADLASTVLTVSEGKVNFWRLSDGSAVDVPAKYHVTTDSDDDLSPALLQTSVSAWKSQLHLRPGNYGKWLPATRQRGAAQKAIPLVRPGYPNTTLYLLA
ncbi:MAG: FecR family protein, partial [Planctomycetota bacterium]